MMIKLVQFYISLFIVLVVPGYFFMMALLHNQKTRLSLIEKFVLSFGLSIAAIDLLLLFMGYVSAPITRSSILVAVIIFSLLCLFISGKRPVQAKNKVPVRSAGDFFDLKNWSYRNILVFLLILFLAMSLRTLYISKGVIPQTTDLGHHMYWSNYIVEFSSLPDYGMPDFIIGEHLVFAAISLISGISFISAMPVIVLLIINIFSLLAIFIFAYRFSRAFFTKKHAKKIALFSIFIIGSFYAVSSPEAKFISGGVVGNIIGNMLIPLVLFSLLMTFKTKKSFYAQLFLVFFATLAYTHHLSTFILLYVLATSLLLTIIVLLFKTKFGIKSTFNLLSDFLSPFFSTNALIIIIISVLYVFFVRMPSYLNSSAIDTAVGVPFKETRTGLTLNNIISSSGPWRMFFGLMGTIFISFGIIFKSDAKLKTFGIILFSWFVIIFLMSWKPSILKVDIPSGRIVSYLTLPLSVLSAIGFYFLLERSKSVFNKYVYLLFFIIMLATGFFSGFADISESARDRDINEEQKVKQTYLAAEYLNRISTQQDNVLKDHIYLEGDTWIKLFFMRGYKYPLSRALLKRYDDPTNDRETCTRDMIAIPDSEIGSKCFEQNNVRFVMLSNGRDNTQFEKSKNFDRLFVSEEVVIFERKAQ